MATNEAHVALDHPTVVPGGPEDPVEESEGQRERRDAADGEDRWRKLIQ